MLTKISFSISSKRCKFSYQGSWLLIAKSSYYTSSWKMKLYKARPLVNEILIAYNRVSSLSGFPTQIRSPGLVEFGLHRAPRERGEQAQVCQSGDSPMRHPNHHLYGDHVLREPRSHPAPRHYSSHPVLLRNPGPVSSLRRQQEVVQVCQSVSRFQTSQREHHDEA